MQAAEMKKLTVQEQIKVIRDEFEQLFDENQAKPEGERVKRAAFEIDPGNSRWVVCRQDRST